MAKSYYMFYLVKAPRVLQYYFWECLWKIKTEDKKIYLTFDDGPVPGPTDFVLETLDRFDAKATFFCIGQNVEKDPGLFNQIIENGHSVGNHTYSHLNGWKTDNEKYFADIQKASGLIASQWFRPPYGRISKFQLYNLINGKKYRLRPVMWHVLSADFDTKINPEQCYLNVVKNAEKGSIVVFHDSEKAFPNLKETLPRVLSFYKDRGFTFEKLDNEGIK